jgi:hypothetical protein
MHERITHKYTYIYITHEETEIYIDIRMHVSNLPSGRPDLHPRPRASECLHVCARAHASAVPPHTTCRAAPRPGRARPAIVRAAGPGAAHTKYNVVTDAVFHAPMSALKADAK